MIYLTNTDSELWMFCAPQMWVTCVAQQKAASSLKGMKLVGWQHRPGLCPEPLLCLGFLLVLGTFSVQLPRMKRYSSKACPEALTVPSLPLALDTRSDWFCTFPKFGHTIIRRTQAVTGVFSLPQWLSQIMKDICISVGKGFPAFPK